MVVKKVMRWSPWAPTPAETRRTYRVKVRVVRVEGLCAGAAPESNGGDGPVPRPVSLEIRWKGPPRSRGLSYLKGRRKPSRCALVKTKAGDGAAEWSAGEDAAFERVCAFSAAEKDGPLGGCDVSFHLLCVKGDRGERKLEATGSTVLNLGDLVSQLHNQGDKESPEQFHVLRELPVSLLAGSADARLSIAVSFVEVKTANHGMSKVKLPEVVGSERSPRAEHDGASAEQCCAFDSDVSDETRQQIQPLPTTPSSGEDSGESSCSVGSTDAEDGKTAAPSAPPHPKRGFLPWRRRRRKTRDNKGGGGRGDCVSSNISSLDEKNLPLPAPGNSGELTVGSWEEKELLSRDGQTKLRAKTFFASIDQRDETAGGESACTALVVVIADALRSDEMNTPTGPQFDALIREGSSAWRRLCGEESYTARFPDRHFDLDTVLEAQLRPVRISPDKSYVGFFQPQSFESLRGAMSFDDVWDEIAAGAGDGRSKVYIVSWNDHFFLLKVEAGAFYVIDTLGERLFEGCDKAYILKFDGSAAMHAVPANRGDEQRLVCAGTECCREFITRFLAAIPLREELEAEEKRGEAPGTNTLHQRLQIEFHLVQASAETDS